LIEITLQKILSLLTSEVVIPTAIPTAIIKHAKLVRVHAVLSTNVNNNNNNNNINKSSSVSAHSADIIEAHESEDNVQYFGNSVV